MSKKKSTTDDIPRLLNPEPPPIKNRRRRALILPKYLADEADKVFYRGERQDQAHAIIKKWADLEKQGHLRRKETALDADFLLDVFGSALGYQTGTDSPDTYQLERNFGVAGVGTADGAVGNFGTAVEPAPVAVIELKDVETDLDKDRSSGRTPVQQCWDYLSALPACTWGIVSNYSTIRLYHRNRTPHAFEEFSLQDLRDLKRFRQFYCLLERSGLLTSPLGQRPRAMQLLEKTENRQREVGDDLYEYYSQNRARMIGHLQAKHGKSRETAIHIAQKLIDRIIFVAFCEDRDLILERSIELAYKTVPPFVKVTNPRWRNFLDLFTAMDQGHAQLRITGDGFNGGLFRHDPEVDELQLDDQWTEFFRQIGDFDFRDEVNVDVLGHLFERSVTELERLRVGPLFAEPDAKTGPVDERPRMPKSRERKTLGTYYTPPAFTHFLVDQTVREVAEQRFDELRESSGLDADEIDAEKSTPALAPFWRGCFEILRRLKVCDPACGSGAFLIRAYDVLEELYFTVVDRIILHEGQVAEQLAETVPDIILAENLFGVDLSEQAVEITQLALWIRSARRGRTLADLSANIICGNSLVSDRAIHPRALDWGAAFPVIFETVKEPGFDCVIGNPPWERMKVQEREFFSFSAPHIAAAVSAAERRRLIAELEDKSPELFAEYLNAKTTAEKTLDYVRKSGAFPLTGKGDVNTYVLFAELAKRIVAPRGRVGVLVPSGIATDVTTKEFFAELMEAKALISLFDFENKAPVFPDVHRSFKFCTLVFGGSNTKMPEADFAFFCRHIEDLEDGSRHVRLSIRDLKLLNPNTRTCPIFRNKRDAELTKAIYKRIPILIDHSRNEGGNPWKARFVRMFDQTNDAELFHDAAALKKLGCAQRGGLWKKGQRTFLPLYEAKMVQAYDHRAASVVVDAANWMRQGQTERTTLVAHQNPEFTAEPRWWVEAADVMRAAGGALPTVFLSFKDVTSSTNQRTMIAAFIPAVGAVNSAPLLITGPEIPPRLECCLLGNLNSFALDFVARQKVGNVHLNFFIVEQLPLFTPDRYADRCPWNKRQTLEKWISDRVLKLTCTADDMRPLAEAAGLDPPVHKWKSEERAELMAELDAAYFLLYGLDRDHVQYILTTFAGAAEPDESTPSMFRSDHLILTAFDRLSQQG